MSPVLTESLKRQLHEIATASLQQRIVYDPGEISADDLGAGALGPGKVWRIPPADRSKGVSGVATASVTVTREQLEIQAKLRAQDVFMTIEEEQTLQAQCAIHGHVWTVRHIPTATNPLGQRGHLKTGDTCIICGVKMP